MIGLVLKDMLVMRKTIRTYAMFLAFYLVMTLLKLFTISFTTAILQLIVMLLPMSAFSFDEMAKWDRYALTFPLGRRALVTGRYLFALIMTVCAGLCGLVSCVLVSIFDNQDMILENMMTVMVCLSLGLLYADILLPLCYKLGPERARPYFYLVIFAPIVLLFGAYQLGVFGAGSLSFLSSVPDPMVVKLSFFLPIIPLLGMWASYLISCRIMEQKEF
ncbi:ABC-2 transporter permease [Lawsonibacter sp. LCP25S3_G6]|uniref:ABC-2 transporter permease n=1 Tax=unclassified Lawsonibacter TaxID=2617946 RepID=UPI003F99B511